ncbi:hypothetical protein [Streptomyces sp. NPDC059063]|uniref:hypothetical protein n=1 Tax=unclassified Streptomyces TaxID=2593676 RepID=UPI0036AD042E
MSTAGTAGATGTASGLPAYQSEESDATAPAADAAGPGARLLGRRGRALGVVALVLATIGFSVPLWGEIRERVVDRVDDAPDGAIGIGTAIAWCTSVLSNIVTLGVLAAVVGVLGAVAARHLPLPAAWGTDRFADFTALRRAFVLGWIAFVLAKLTCWSLGRIALGESMSRAVPSVTHLDAWLPLLPCALLLAGRAAGTTWARAACVAAAVTAVYATALGLLPS